MQGIPDNVLMTPDTFPDMAHLKGPLLLGYVASGMLFGCSALSFVNYTQFSMSADRRGTRVVVWLTAIMACVSAAFTIATTLRHYSFRFGQLPTYADAVWQSWHHVSDGIIRLLVSGFFARRAWKMYGRPVLLAIFLTAALLITAGGSVGATITSMRGKPKDQDIQARIMAYVWLGSEVLGDAAITTLLVIKLLRTKTDWKPSDSVIKKVMKLGMETQAPPTMIALAYLCVYILASRPAYSDFFVCLPMVYVACIFATLNSRYRVSAQKTNDAVSVFDDQGKSRRTVPTAINVTTETYTVGEIVDGDTQSATRKTKRRSSFESGSGHDEPRGINTSEVRLV